MRSHAWFRALGLLVAAVAIPLDQRSPWKIILDQRRDARLLLQRQLAPRRDEITCATGCSLQKLCLRPPCIGGPECEDDPDADPGLWNGWGTSLRKSQPCADDLEAKLCASARGKVCQDPEGVDSEVTEEPLLEGECKSISPSTTDGWCIKAFGRKPEKAAASTTCRCGRAAPAPPSPPSPSCDDALWGGKASCLSVSGAHDQWCQDTCKSCKACPLTECRCGPEEEAEIALRVRDAVHVCDFEAMACAPPSPSGSATLCKSCADHITDCLLIPRLDEEGNLIQPLDTCLHDVAGKPKCRTCNTTESTSAFKVRYWPSLADLLRVRNVQHERPTR